MKTAWLWFLLLVLLICISMSDSKRRRRKRRRIRVTFRIGYRRRFRAVNDGNDVDLPCQFEKYDENGDELVSLEELQATLTEFDPDIDSVSTAKFVMEELDFDENGFLHIEEFYLDERYQEDCLIVKLLRDSRVRNDKSKDMRNSSAT